MKRFWIFIALAAACGGKAVIDGDPVGGNGGDSGTTTTSTGGSPTVTTTSVGGGGECPPVEVECPAIPPTEGGDCRCAEGLFCEYDECLTEATINGYECDRDDATWRQISVSMCQQPFCPNGMFCNLGEVCLIVNTGFQVTFSCAPNICSPTYPLDCDCAADLCGDTNDFVCIDTDETSVTCECITC